MKKIILIMTIFLLVSLPCFASSDYFLDAPVLHGGKIIYKTKDRLVIATDMTHDQVLDFYREALNNQPDIKYRDWKVATYIEDDGKQAWHSITISKDKTESNSVTIAKESWSWIIGTLTLGFIGVFIVLCVLYLGMSFSGMIISRSSAKTQAKQHE